MIPALTNHLWQSTLFAAVAGLLTLALRKNRAQTRHWVWLAASMKFLIPFSLLVAAGGQLNWHTAPVAAQPRLAFVIEELSQPLVAPMVSTPVAAATETGLSPTRYRRHRVGMRDARGVVSLVVPMVQNQGRSALVGNIAPGVSHSGKNVCLAH